MNFARRSRDMVTKETFPSYIGIHRIWLLLVFVRSELDLVVESYKCANIYCVSL